MDKDEAVTEAFELCESLDQEIASLSSLQMLKLVNAIAKGFQKVYAIGFESGVNMSSPTTKPPVLDYTKE